MPREKYLGKLNPEQISENAAVDIGGEVVDASGSGFTSSLSDEDQKYFNQDIINRFVYSQA